jgi:hypothetical protein
MEKFNPREESVEHEKDKSISDLLEDIGEPLTDEGVQDKDLSDLLEDIGEPISDESSESTEITRPLTDDEKKNYKEKLGCSDKLLDKATIDKNGKVHIKTRNDVKEGQEGANGVKYERKTVVINGVEVEGVFPVFGNKFDAKLPEDSLQSSDSKQEVCCNQQLKEAVENDPELAKQFTPEQLEQIKKGETPDGYTWHHNEESGKMQLVKTEDHQANAHTGGRVIWGGGQGNRQ